VELFYTVEKLLRWLLVKVKLLVSTLPAYLNALAGEGVHIVYSE
jgi:hypothetical protein